MEGKSIKRDSNGVPQYSAKDIEVQAEQFIGDYDASILSKPQAIPLEGICEWIRDKIGVPIHFGVDLNGGDTKRKSQLLGLIKFNPPTIYIDKSAELWQPSFNFTLAHEIGHLNLHCDLKLSAPLNPNPFEDSAHDLVTGKKLLRTPLDRIEWQANRFAAALLMPRRTIRKALVEAQKSIDLSPRRRGFVYVENNPSSLRDYNLTLMHISNLFKASKSAVQYRLTDLGIFTDKRMATTTHISQLYRARVKAG